MREVEIVLILLTYHGGNSVAQGFAHDLAGVVTFLFAMVGMLALDGLLTLFQAKARSRA